MSNSHNSMRQTSMDIPYSIEVGTKEMSDNNQHQDDAGSLPPTTLGHAGEVDGGMALLLLNIRRMEWPTQSVRSSSIHMRMIQHHLLNMLRTLNIMTRITLIGHLISLEKIPTPKKRPTRSTLITIK